MNGMSSGVEDMESLSAVAPVDDNIKVSEDDGSGNQTETIKEEQLQLQLQQEEEKKKEEPQHQNPPLPQDSDSDENSSTTTASTASSDDSSDGDSVKDMEPEFAFLSEDEDEAGAPKGPIRSKNESQSLPAVPPVDAILEPHHQTLPVGLVSSVIGCKVIVDGSVKHNPLNEGSILWITETKSPLGWVDEIFGPVKNPYYIVRYNSDEEIPDGVHVGTTVSFVPDFCAHIINENSLHKKGYDASGENDEELSDEIEFSDDEKEVEYRRAQKQSKRGSGSDKHVNHERPNSKKAHSKGARFQKNSQHQVPDAGGVIQQHATTNLNQPPVPNLSHFGPIGFFGPTSGAFGSGSPTVPAVSHAMQSNVFLAGQQQHLLAQHQNAFSAYGAPMLQQQNLSLFGGFLPNPSQFQQPLDCFMHHNYQQLQQHQLAAGFPNGVPFHQQLASNQGVLPTYGLNGLLPNPFLGTTHSSGLQTGHESFNQMFVPGKTTELGVGTAGVSNGNPFDRRIPSVSLPSSIPLPMQFNMGLPPNPGGPAHRSNGRPPFGRRG